MKPVAAIATALLSFAAGWVLKPTPDAITGGSGVQGASANSGKGGGRGVDEDGAPSGKTHIRKDLVLTPRGSKGSSAEEDAEIASRRPPPTLGGVSSAIARRTSATRSRLAQ